MIDWNKLKLVARLIVLWLCVTVLSRNTGCWWNGWTVR